MAQPLIPWEPCNIPEEIQGEFNRRKVNRSFKFIEGTKGEWNESDGEWNKYRGPMTPWVRFCSNGSGRYNQSLKSFDKEGFVFFGGKNFYNGYGFSEVEGEKNVGIIGYMPNKKATPHTIDNDINTSNYPIHVPAPEIEKISVTIQKELYRRATVEWVCFSKAQLEYMTPYFLVPGITCTLEWGWNHFDPASLIDITDVELLKKLNNNPYPLYTKHILKSKGNYDVLFGKITHFEWSADGNKIKCKTEITSQDRIYAGLVVDANTVDQVKDSKGNDVDIKPLDNLTQFVDKILTQFKGVSAKSPPLSISKLKDFILYIKRKHPNNWRDYVYGVFYGRDLEDPKDPLKKGANVEDDFDRKNGNNKDLWINFGLLMEMINYHSDPLRGFRGDAMFRIDIDDCVIGAHPNMISSDGGILLVPNAEAPKYFKGLFGANTEGTKVSDFDIFKKADVILPVKPRDISEKEGKLADYRVSKICRQAPSCYRDDLDSIINHIRYEANSAATSYEFPFKADRAVVPNSKPYPRRYSGYLKHLYFNVECLQSILKNSADIKTYPILIEKILEKVNEAAGNFWDFRLVAGTGNYNLPDDETATMKIVDYRFMSTANRGTPYTFDYFDADSLLMGIGFKPTLSNAQAIRTIYAQTNNPEKKNVLTNGENELLDYKFNDRLFKDEDKKVTTPVISSTDQFDEAMRALQQIKPANGSYQITTLGSDGSPIVRRLVMPGSDILKLMLDDGDEENNPKYTGIMPGIQATFTVQGIGGLRTFMMFLVRNLPEPYSHQNIVFRIVDVQETIDAGKWTTSITAGVIPLRDHIKKRLGVNF